MTLIALLTQAKYTPLITNLEPLGVKGVIIFEYFR